MRGRVRMTIVPEMIIIVMKRFEFYGLFSSSLIEITKTTMKNKKARRRSKILQIWSLISLPISACVLHVHFCVKRMYIRSLQRSQ
jgi:hypothetical protein